MRSLLPCPPCGRQGRPGEGFLAGSIEKPRGSAPRERDHRGGDHPVPSRTRQLSPPSPRVLQRKAAGGQGVALAEGAFLCARRAAASRRARARHAPERPAGEVPLRASPRFEGIDLTQRPRSRSHRHHRSGRIPWEVACSRCVPKRLQRILLRPFLLRFEVGWLDRGPLDSQWLGVLGLRAQQRFPLRSPCYFSWWSDSIAPAQLFRHSIGS